MTEVGVEGVEQATVCHSQRSGSRARGLHQGDGSEPAIFGTKALDVHRDQLPLFVRHPPSAEHTMNSFSVVLLLVSPPLQSVSTLPQTTALARFLFGRCIDRNHKIIWGQFRIPDGAFQVLLNRHNASASHSSILASFPASRCFQTCSQHGFAEPSLDPQCGSPTARTPGHRQAEARPFPGFLPSPCRAFSACPTSNSAACHFAGTPECRGAAGNFASADHEPLAFHFTPTHLPPAF